MVVLEFIGFSKLLLIPHWLVLGIAFAWCVRLTPSFGVRGVVLDVLGALSALVAGAVSLVLFFEDPSGRGQLTAAGAYLIYSVVTVGVVPLFVLSCFALTGRLAGRVAARIIER